jgi:hypothetical protein
MNKITHFIILTSSFFLAACNTSNEPVILEAKQIAMTGEPSSTLELTLIKKDKICILKAKTTSKNTPIIEKDWAFFREDLILISENSSSEPVINSDAPDAKIEEHIEEMKIRKEAKEIKSFISKENLKKCT